MKLDGLAVHVVPAEGEKCERCWIVTPDVGKNEAHPDICPRCADVIDRLGGIEQFQQ
jgi:isoleucyl-tRNA synthetase